MESEKRDEPSDESDAFGLYVSQCLKKMDERARIIAKHQIENIVFQAQVGALSAAPRQSNMDDLYREGSLHRTSTIVKVLCMNLPDRVLALYCTDVVPVVVINYCSVHPGINVCVTKEL